MTRQRIWLVAVAGVLVLLVVAGLVWWGLARRGVVAVPDEVVQVVGQLPGGGEREGVFEEEMGRAADVPEGATAPVGVAEAHTVTIPITYQTQPQFRLTLGLVRETISPPTIQAYEPGAGDAFSVLKVLDSTGAVLTEHHFTIRTQFAFETFPLTEASVEVDTIPSGEIELVVPVVGTPAQVVIETPDGQVVTQAVVGRASSWWHIPQALAQGSRVFTIAVTNQLGAEGGELLQAHEATTAILEEQPWKTYAQRGLVKVLPPAYNQTTDLLCGTVTVAGGRTKPGCVSEGLVRSFVEADVVVVVVRAGCGECGAVKFGSGVVAVGTAATKRLVLHEIAHALPNYLQDEYLGRRGLRRPELGSNCLFSQSACAEAIAGLTGASCQAGCNAPNTWRTSADGVMFSGTAPHRPFQACKISEVLSEVAGVDELGFCQSGDSSREKFWGWFRGG